MTLLICPECHTELKGLIRLHELTYAHYIEKENLPTCGAVPNDAELIRANHHYHQCPECFYEAEQEDFETNYAF